MDALVAIAAVAVGWVLNEISRDRESSRNRKEAISSALSVMLEMRHRAKTIKYVLDRMQNAGAPGEIIPVMRALFDALLPQSEKDSIAYYEAVAELAKTSPLLAFQYRSRERLFDFLKNWREMMSSGGLAPADMEKLESQLNSVIEPHIDDGCIELAWKHSMVAWWKIRQALKKEYKFPDELEELLTSLLDQEGS